MSRPSPFDSVVNPLSGDAGFNGPIDNAHTLAVMLKNDIPAVVSGLLFRCGPMAVLWLVVAIVVLAINLHAGFVAYSHVSDEIVNVMPSLAYGYTATSIAIIFLIFWICATSNHGSPYVVKRRSPSSVLCYTFLLKATAALRFAVTKTVHTHVARRATTGALHAGKEMPHPILPKDAKDGETPEDIASCYGGRSCFNHGSIPLYRQYVF